jgi:hypothetical protein
VKPVHVVRLIRATIAVVDVLAKYKSNYQSFKESGPLQLSPDSYFLSEHKLALKLTLLLSGAAALELPHKVM